jgi:hypothetical protein
MMKLQRNLRRTQLVPRLAGYDTDWNGLIADLWDALLIL